MNLIKLNFTSNFVRQWDGGETGEHVLEFYNNLITVNQLLSNMTLFHDLLVMNWFEVTKFHN